MYCGPPALFTLTRKLFRLKFQLYMFAYFTVVWHTFLISGFKVSYGLKKVKNNGWLRQNIDFSSISCMSNEAFPRKREKSQIYCWHDIISTADCRLRTGGEKRKPRIHCRRQTTDFLSTCRVNLGYCVSTVLICSLNLGYQTLYGIIWKLTEPSDAKLNNLCGKQNFPLTKCRTKVSYTYHGEES